MPGSQPSSQTTNLTVTCTADSVISSLTSTSSNGWRFVGATHGDYVNYSMRVNSITGTYFDDINNSYAMSGSSGSTSPVTVNSSPIAIDASATPLTMGIGVSPVTVPATTAVDTYSDTVTISTTF